MTTMKKWLNKMCKAVLEMIPEIVTENAGNKSVVDMLVDQFLKGILQDYPGRVTLVRDIYRRFQGYRGGGGALVTPEVFLGALRKAGVAIGVKYKIEDFAYYGCLVVKDKILLGPNNEGCWFTGPKRERKVQKITNTNGRVEGTTGVQKKNVQQPLSGGKPAAMQVGSTVGR